MPMFAPRARSHHDENAQSLHTRTPGPSIQRSRPTASPLKVKNIEGNSPGKPSTASPKKHLKSATPGASTTAFRSALGDKTNNHKQSARTPFQQEDTGKSPSKGTGSCRPSKSPSKVLRAPAHPFLKTPAAPPRSLQRAQSFETPAANIGRKGMMKQRLGELMDAQRMMASGGSVQPGADSQVEQADAQSHWTDGLTEDELYPEIEYIPPSKEAKGEVWDRPPQFDGLPTAKELARLLSKPDFTAHLAKDARPRSPPKAPEMEFSSDSDLKEGKAQRKMIGQPGNGSQSDEDDDGLPYADVRPSKGEVATVASVRPRAFASTALPDRTQAPQTKLNSARAGVAGTSGSVAGRKPAVQQRQATVGVRIPSSINDSIARPAASQIRSNAIHGMRTTSSTRSGKSVTAGSVSQPRQQVSSSAVRPSVNGNAARQTQRKPGPGGRSVTSSVIKVSSSPSTRSTASSRASSPTRAAPQRHRHPALRDLCNDELGRAVEAELQTTHKADLSLAPGELLTDFDLGIDDDSKVDGQQ